jgi:hypothetical protein
MKKYEWPTQILPDGDKRFRSLEINNGGELVYEQTDLGRVTAHLAPNGGDSDYEYWVIVDSDALEDVIVRLIRERFDSQGDFKRWLERNEIRHDFIAY